MRYEMNPGVLEAVWQLKREGMSDAVPIYCGAPPCLYGHHAPHP